MTLLHSAELTPVLLSGLIPVATVSLRPEAEQRTALHRNILAKSAVDTARLGTPYRPNAWINGIE